MRSNPGSDVLLVCTDRGRHSRRKLGLLRVDGGTVYFTPWAADGSGVETPWPGRVRCPSCGRDWQRRADVLALHLDALIHDGLERLDLSMLR